MKINIQAPWEVNGYLREVIESKLEKLITFNDRILHADVFLKMGDKQGVEDKLIEVRLRAPGPDCFAQDAADSFEKAVAGVAEKLKAQLLKNKGKSQPY